MAVSHHRDRRRAVSAAVGVLAANDYAVSLPATRAFIVPNGMLMRVRRARVDFHADRCPPRLLPAKGRERLRAHERTAGGATSQWYETLVAPCVRPGTSHTQQKRVIRGPSVYFCVSPAHPSTWAPSSRQVSGPPHCLPHRTHLILHIKLRDCSKNA